MYNLLHQISQDYPGYIFFFKDLMLEKFSVSWIVLRNIFQELNLVCITLMRAVRMSIEL